MAGRLWKLRQRFGIAAPKVLVRTHVPWYLRWLGFAVMFAFSAALAVWMYDAGRRFAGFDRSEVEQELSATRIELGKLREELERLRAVANAADSKVSIERTAQQKLAQQIKGLEQDNARLREELAIFESIMPTPSEDLEKTLTLLNAAKGVQKGFDYAALKADGCLAIINAAVYLFENKVDHH